MGAAGKPAAPTTYDPAWEVATDRERRDRPGERDRRASEDHVAHKQTYSRATPHERHVLAADRDGEEFRVAADEVGEAAPLCPPALHPTLGGPLGPPGQELRPHPREKPA